MDNYDPKTGKIELIDLCLSAGHMAFGNDKDETLYFTDTPGPSLPGWAASAG
jgi:hypothetical protein